MTSSKEVILLMPIYFEIRPLYFSELATLQFCRATEKEITTTLMRFPSNCKKSSTILLTIFLMQKQKNKNKKTF